MTDPTVIEEEAPPPPPVEIGDYVVYGSKRSDFQSRVIAIDEDFAWCRPLSGAEPFTARRADLRPVPREAS